MYALQRRTNFHQLVMCPSIFWRVEMRLPIMTSLHMVYQNCTLLSLLKLWLIYFASDFSWRIWPESFDLSQARACFRNSSLYFFPSTKGAVCCKKRNYFLPFLTANRLLLTNTYQLASVSHNLSHEKSKFCTSPPSIVHADFSRIISSFLQKYQTLTWKKISTN